MEGSVDLGELVFGAGEADFESFDFAEPSFAFGFDVIAYTFGISLNATTWAGRIGLLLLPPIAYYVTYRVCLGLQRADRSILEHGIETGIISGCPMVSSSRCTILLGVSTATATPSRWSTRGRACPSG